MSITRTSRIELKKAIGEEFKCWRKAALAEKRRHMVEKTRDSLDRLLINDGLSTTQVWEAVELMKALMWLLCYTPELKEEE
jgi:hypothetical protein